VTDPVLLIHGGAWAIPDELVEAHLNGVKKAIDAGWRVLEKRGSALDAVEEAVVIMEDDEAFRQLLRGLNKTFYHQTVTTQEVEQYMSQVVGMNLSKVFDQYLRHTTIPTLEYRFNGQQIQYRWVSDVKDFNMPVKVKLSDNGLS